MDRLLAISRYEKLFIRLKRRNLLSFSFSWLETSHWKRSTSVFCWISVTKRASPRKNNRVLSKQFKDLPPFVLESTLNVNFEPKIWSFTLTILLKRWTNQGPMKMQVIAQRKGVLHVDLLDSVGDDNYFSVRDCLMYLEDPSSFAVPKKFNSKEELESSLRKEDAVIIKNSSQPSEMYFQVVDDDLQLYN